MSPIEVRNLRRLAHLSQFDLAERSGVGRSLLAQFETGRTRLGNAKLVAVEEALRAALLERAVAFRDALRGEQKQVAI